MSVNFENESKEKENKKESIKENIMDIFATVYEEVRIPSNGLIYPKESGLFNSKTIQIRPMTASDEDALTSQTAMRTNTWLDKILRNCIVNTNVDLNSLLLGDKYSILFWLRQNAYGSSYDLKVTCPACNEQFENSFQLNQIQLKNLDTQPIELGTNMFLFVLPKSGVQVIFKLFTSKMAEELEKEAEDMKKVGLEKFITLRLSKQIVQIADVKDKDKINKLISMMPATDSLALRNYIDEITPDIILKQNAKCIHCGKVESYSIPIEAQFFWPQSRP